MADENDQQAIITRTYRLRRATVERLEQLAKQQEAWPSPLLDLLLQRAIDAVESGEWPLNRTPTRYKHHW